MAEQPGSTETRNRSSSGGPSGPGPEKHSIDGFGALQVPPVAPGLAELPPTRFEGEGFKVSMAQHMGDRKTQEDRFLIVPKLDSGVDQSLFGVFDGTVGDFASENVKDIVIPTLLATEDWKQLNPSRTREEKQFMLERCMRDMYPTAD